MPAPTKPGLVGLDGKPLNAKSKILTVPFRVSYNFVFKPKTEENDSGKTNTIYSVQAMFEHNADVSIMRALAALCAKEKWGDKAEKMPLKLFTPGEEMTTYADHPEYEGMLICQMKSYNTPVDVLLPSKQKIETPEQQALFYSGCWARASVTCFAYDGKANPKAKHSNRGVSFSLQGLMKVKDDQPLVNVRNVENDFKEVEAEVHDNSSEFIDDDDY